MFDATPDRRARREGHDHEPGGALAEGAAHHSIVAPCTGYPRTCRVVLTTYATTVTQAGPLVSKVKPDFVIEVTQNCMVAPVIPVYVFDEMTA